MLKFIKKYAVVSAEEEKFLSNYFARANKAKIKETITYLAPLFEQNLKGSALYENQNLNHVFSKKIALLLARCPQLFLLETNPANNNSFKYKTAFYNKYFDTTEFRLICGMPELLLADTYPGGKAEKILDYLSKELNLAQRHIKKMLINYPQLVNLECNEEFKERVKFWKEMSEQGNIPFDKFITRHTRFLGQSVSPEIPNSMYNRFQFYINKFNISNKNLMNQIYKFPNFFSLDLDKNKPNCVQNKIEKYNEVGIDDTVIKGNLKILGAPLQKIKLRFLLYKYLGLTKAEYLNSKFMFNEAKLYARGRYIYDTKANVSLFDVTEAEFVKLTNKKIADLMEIYPLTEDVVHKIEYNYNFTRENKIYLNDSELKALNFNEDEESVLGE